MVHCNSKPSSFQIPQSQPVLLHSFIIFLFLLLLPFANSLSFNFSSFQPNTQGIIYQGDAFSAGEVIQVTKNQQDSSLTRSIGRASYAQPVHLWDSKTGILTDFNTHFSFIIKATTSYGDGDGLAFFFSPYQAEIPINSGGGLLGLFENTTAFNHTNNQIVAVEFDTFQNPWDPSADHVGIDVNSIDSVAKIAWNTSIKTGQIGNAWVNYNSTTKALNVYLTYATNPVFQGNYSLSYVVDLRQVLPEWVTIGFSAATGDWIEIHNIISWTFNSTLENLTTTVPTIVPTMVMGHKTNPGLVVGLVVSIFALSCGLGLLWFIKQKKMAVSGRKDVGLDAAIDDDEDFEKETGPRRFTFLELSRATNNFSEGGKLGQGGFGGVYKGLLSDTNGEIAVKRVSKGSKQGKKEYLSEVKIISQLRHRNLVQLIGWCHEQGDFLLIYELMPNGSLDTHLFGGKSKLTWPLRHKIALGLASALLYLHEEWEQCVVHRDIKSSNIMLDSNYNAKLGDFGLARLVDHELGLQTTILAGTMGYLAPECVTTGKASKESDVYSFGIVALEIACGRKPVELKKEPDEVRLLEWVWSLYGKGKLIEAIDKNLTMGYDEREMAQLMVVGLWCCHPDLTLRPSIRQVINVLNFEAPLPALPSLMPVPVYFAPPMTTWMFGYTSSILTTNSEQERTRYSRSSHGSSLSVGSSTAFLELQEAKV